MTLEATDTLVAQAGIEGWDFRDEVETANALVPELRAPGRRGDRRAVARGRVADAAAR